MQIVFTRNLYYDRITEREKTNKNDIYKEIITMKKTIKTNTIKTKVMAAVLAAVTMASAISVPPKLSVPHLNSRMQQKVF